VKVRLPASGPGVEAPPFLGVVLLVDLLVALAVLALAAWSLATDGGGAFPMTRGEAVGAAALAVLVLVADVAAGRLSPAGLTWRRRLGYVAMGAAVWRGGILREHREAAALVTLYSGVVWIALVVGGRALSRAIASATGEDKPE
jgi:hypothetical protein